MTLICGLIALSVQAGGSGLNTLVVINQNSSNSVALGNYFCERRQVPPENVLRIAWPGANTWWDETQFQTNLLQPLLQALAARQLTNQIHYVALSMDIPHQTTVNGGSVNGTTSGLFFGLKSDGINGSPILTNSYCAKELPFPAAKPNAAQGHSFLATMITAGSLAQAKHLVDQGVDSDATFPSAPVVLAKSSDPLRNIRYHTFDNAVFNTRLRGNYSIVRTNSDSPAGQGGLLGYETGLMNYTISPDTFVPGAMADSLTSFGGVIFGYNVQTSLLGFIHAGAAGSYGTVSEPQPVPEKFPNPQNHFYQARGFSLAECYYLSLDTPYQGLVVGEPLASPFARSGSGIWVGIDPGDALNGQPQLTVQFTAADVSHPLQQVDLFVDGKFLRTLTNIAPAAGNQLNARINGQNVSYTVPANATLASVASGFAATLNSPVTTNLTKTVAFAFGDRIELRYLGTNRPVEPSSFRVTGSDAGGSPPDDGPAFSATAGSAATATTALLASRPTFLNSTARGIKACYVNGTVQVGTWLRLTVTKTNGSIVNVAVTNQILGASVDSLVSNLVALVNGEPALQGSDGVAIEDYAGGYFGGSAFNLLAQSPGLRAAGVRVQLSSSGSLVLNPSAAVALTENLSDLQPRNHLYVAAGVEQLEVTFPLDTATLADGFHELTAVAYEGSHVRTQTRVTLPVRVENTTLTALLTLVDLVETNSVTGTYHIAVDAGTNGVSSITLYSTGGPYASVTNQAVTTFNVSGVSLGVGLHPFFAIVQATDGRRYRTETKWARFTN